MVRKAQQSGMALLEALIGILLFSIGILAMVAMQAASVNTVADAQYRIEAVNAANQLLSKMWVSVDRTSDASMSTSLLTFAHQTTIDEPCKFSGGPAANAGATAWLNLVNTGKADGSGSKSLLPGSTAAMQQIVVATGSSNQVTITVCWRAPNDTAPRSHTVVAYVN